MSFKERADRRRKRNLSLSVAEIFGFSDRRYVSFNEELGYLHSVLAIRHE